MDARQQTGSGFWHHMVVKAKQGHRGPAYKVKMGMGGRERMITTHRHLDAPRHTERYTGLQLEKTRMLHHA